MAAGSNPGYNQRMMRRGRWHRVVAYGLAALGACAVALLLVRACRDYEPVAERAFLEVNRPMVIAHRGASALTTEHTLEAFELALEAGADVLELDLRLTADGIPLIAHDRDLARPLGVASPIAETPLADLRAAVGEAKPERPAHEMLLTFEDALRRFSDERLNVELKDNDPALAEAAYRLIERHEAHDRVLVASFHAGVLRAFREVSQGTTATSAATSEALRFYGCYLVRMPCRPSFEALQIPPSAGSSWLAPDLSKRRFIAFAHRHGLAVHYWTIDDPTEIERLFAAGADGVMTNDPAVAAAARAAALEEADHAR